MKIIKMIIAALLTVALTGCSSEENTSSLYGTGTIESTNVLISARNAGQVETIYYSEGQLISAGDTIMTIDHEALDFQLAQSEAGVQIAKAQLELMLKGARSEDIQQAEEMMKQSEINYNNAQKDFQRYEQLWQSKSISDKQFEDIKSRYEINLAQFNSAKENLKKVKRIFRPEEIEQAKGNLKKAEATVGLLKKNIKDSYIISPLNGFIVKNFVESGEIVTPMSSLVKISNLSTVELIIYVSEIELGKVKLGQKAVITVDTYPEKKYEGRVTFISPEAEFTPKNVQTKDERTKLVFAVKIEVPNKEFDLKSGMPADAEVYL